VTAVIGWRFAYVIRTTYKWWVEVCANGKQEVATGCFHRWSGHELTPLHRPISFSFSPSLFLYLSTYSNLSLLPLSPSHCRAAFPSSTISPSLPVIFFYAPKSLLLPRVLVSMPSFVFLCSPLIVLFSLSLSLSFSLAEASTDPWYVMLDV